jgi:glycerol-3-phosphate acyltransferase PlsY
MRFAGILFLVYLAGSVNFAVILLGFLGKGDPRTAFSGNAGTTNVYRQAGKGWAAVVLVLDVGRGACLAMLAAALLRDDLIPWVGLALVVGNRFPCFHRFRGGKGVASYLGFTLALSPWGAAVSCLLWVAVQRIVQIPFIASFCMIMTLGAVTIAAGGAQAVPFAGTTLTVLLIVLSHRENILSLAEAKRRP